MKQSLSSMMNLATERSKSNEPASNTTSGPSAKAEPKEKTFHEKELARKIADPQNLKYEAAKILGKQRANALLQSATNKNDKNHEASFATLKNIYNLDTTALEEDCIAKAAHELSAAPFEMRDPNYEEKALKAFQPVHDIAPVKAKLYSNCFIPDVKSKWEKSGYSADDKIIPAIADKYKLTSLPSAWDNFELKK